MRFISTQRLETQSNGTEERIPRRNASCLSEAAGKGFKIDAESTAMPGGIRQGIAVRLSLAREIQRMEIRGRAQKRSAADSTLRWLFLFDGLTSAFSSRCGMGVAESARA